MNEAVQNILSNISVKINRLKQRTKRLEDENNVLRETVFKHLSTIDDINKKMEQLKGDKLVDEISKNSKLNAKQIIKSIDNYIKVIDNSIANLKQQ
jgi:predicted nuclease with TOPRIM domain